MIDKTDFIFKREGSSKTIRRAYRAYCDSCKCDRGYKRIHESDFKCKSCANIGKTLTEITKEKLSIAQTEHQKNNPNPFLGKQHSKDTKNKISIISSRQNVTYKKDFIYKNNKIEIQMRSGWELKYANHLDSQNIIWKYESTIFSLSDGSTYIPDFELEDKTIVEIKGYFRPKSEIKWNIFCREYPNIKKMLLRKHDLQELKIIK